MAGYTQQGHGGGIVATVTGSTFTPAVGDVVLALIDSYDAQTWTGAGTTTGDSGGWGTWETIFNSAADANGHYGVVVGVKITTSAAGAPTVGPTGGPFAMDVVFYQISGLDVSGGLAGIFPQTPTYTGGTSGTTTASKQMIGSLSAFSNAANECLALRWGYGSLPWTSPNLTQLDTDLTDYDYTNVWHHTGEVLAPEVDGNDNGTAMGILAMELKAAGVVHETADSTAMRARAGGAKHAFGVARRAHRWLRGEGGILVPA